MKHVFLIVALFWFAVASRAQEPEVEEQPVSKRALTSTGLTYSFGYNVRLSNFFDVGLNANIGKRIIPNLQVGAGIMPSFCADVNIFKLLFLDPDFENDGDPFFVMPTYVWVKYDFTKRMVSPYLNLQVGKQVSSYSKANGSTYVGGFVGCRIALRKVAICPYLGFTGDSSDYNDDYALDSNLMTTVGINVEF